MDSTLDTTLDCKLRDFEVSFGVLNPILTIGYNADVTDYGQLKRDYRYVDNVIDSLLSAS